MCVWILEWDARFVPCPRRARVWCLGVTTRFDVGVRSAVRARPCITRRRAVCTTFHAFFSRLLLLLLMLLTLRSGLVR